MTSSKLSALHVTSRVAAGLLGGYAFTWGFATLGVASGAALGMSYHDAQALFSILAFLVFPACLGWAFVARSLALAWTALVGGGGLMTLLAWQVARALIP